MKSIRHETQTNSILRQGRLRSSQLLIWEIPSTREKSSGMFIIPGKRNLLFWGLSFLSLIFVTGIAKIVSVSAFLNGVCRNYVRWHFHVIFAVIVWKSRTTFRNWSSNLIWVINITYVVDKSTKWWSTVGDSYGYKSRSLKNCVLILGIRCKIK